MRKACTVLLIGAMLTGSLCACSAKNLGGQEGESGGPWYEMKSFETTDRGKVSGWTQYGNTIISCDDESITLLEVYIVGSQDEVTFDTAYEEKDDVFSISKYSLADENYGELIGYYDIMSGDIMAYEAEYYWSTRLIECFENDGYIDILVDKTDLDTYESNFKVYRVDLDTGSLVSERIVDLSALGAANMISFDQINKTDDGYVFATSVWGEPKIKISHFDNDFNYIDSEEIGGFESYYATYISDFKMIDDNYYYFDLLDVSDNEIGILYNVETGEMTEQPAFYSWSNTSMLSADRVYTSDAFSITSYNMLTGEEELVMDYNNCILDRSKVSDGMSIYYADDNKLISYTMSTHGYTVVEFDRIFSDPFEGKTPISVAFLSGYIDDVESQVIYQYNMNSEDSYIYVDSRYDLMANIDFDSDEDWDTMARNSATIISDQLIVDIIAGVGPDIIVGGYEYNQFNNSNVLVDLMPIIDADTEFNREDYFGAIFATDNGALYQIPYQVALKTLYGPSDVADTYCNPDGGISMDNYITMVEEVDDGFDPFLNGATRENGFISMFNWNRDYFFDEDGRISIDRDAFQLLADYAASFPSVSMDEYWDMTWDMNFNIKFSNATAMDFWGGEVVMGLPGPEGVPPILYCSNSVGITTNCDDVDGAWNFIKVLFDEDNQMDLRYNMVNRNARTIHEAESVDEYIRMIEMDNALYGFNEQTLNYSDDVVDSYIAALDSATRVYSSDSDIDLIIFEEIQAYFAGDKTIDEVIDLIENRAQLVIDERG